MASAGGRIKLVLDTKPNSGYRDELARRLSLSLAAQTGSVGWCGDWWSAAGSQHDEGKGLGGRRGDHGPCPYDFQKTRRAEAGGDAGWAEWVPRPRVGSAMVKALRGRSGGGMLGTCAHATILSAAAWADQRVGFGLASPPEVMSPHSGRALNSIMAQWYWRG